MDSTLVTAMAGDSAPPVLLSSSVDATGAPNIQLHLCREGTASSALHTINCLSSQPSAMTAAFTSGTASGMTSTLDRSVAEFSFNDSDTSTNAEKIRGQLRMARDYGRKRRLRVSIPSLLIGMTFNVLFLCGIFYNPFGNAMEGTEAGAENGNSLAFWWRVANFCSALVGGPTTLLAILPDDKRAIQFVAVALIVITWCVIFYHLESIHRGILLKTSGDCEDTENDFPCFAIVPSICIFGLWAICNIVLIVPYMRVLRRAHHAMLLRCTWTFFSRGLFLGGSMMITVAVLIGITSEEARTRPNFWEFLARNGAIGFSAIGASFIFGRRSFRNSAQSWLASRQEAPAAAGIAAMLSGQTEDDLWQQAKSSFRFVPGNKVKEKDMKDNTPNPQLRKLTQSGHLGAVDAFVSHSWHDDSHSKWKALQEWRKEFKLYHGREPRLWIDKNCIDQGDIQRSLACLPVYVAGCKQFLGLCGPTYLKRLWCLMELFVFVEMGRTPESIVAFPVGARASGGLEKLLQQIQSFHATEATCFLTEDSYNNDRILSVDDSFVLPDSMDCVSTSSQSTNEYPEVHTASSVGTWLADEHPMVACERRVLPEKFSL